MEKEHFETLEEDYIFLCRHMMKNTKLFVDFLMEEKKIMDEETGEDIMDEVSHFKRAQRMLDFTMKKNNERAFEALYAGCLHIHAWEAADILMPENAPHKPEEDETFVEHLPEQWPTESDLVAIKNPSKLGLKICGPDMRKKYQECTNPNLQTATTMYNMTRKDKGRMLIIDNSQFDSLPERPGSDYDSKGLSYLFSNLGFEVKQVQNLKAAEMRKFLTAETGKNTDLPRANCVILAIMSYGYDGYNGVFGTDGVYNKEKEKCQNFIEMSEIKKNFTKDYLINKPKVFLIVAQQASKEYVDRRRRPPRFDKDKRLKLGDREDIGAIGAMKDLMEPLITLPPSIKKPNINIELPKIMLEDPMKKFESKFKLYESMGASKVSMKHHDISHSLKSIGLNSKSLTQADGFGETDGPGDDKTPKDADIFMVVVAPRDMLTLFENSIGSWFIQSFIYVVAKYAFQKDLRELLEKVNEMAASRQRLEAEDIECCLPSFTTNKKLYFFPGILPED